MNFMLRSVALYLTVCLLATGFANEFGHDGIEETFNGHIENHHREEFVEHNNQNFDNGSERHENPQIHHEFTHDERITHNDSGNFVESSHHDEDSRRESNSEGARESNNVESNQHEFSSGSGQTNEEFHETRIEQNVFTEPTEKANNVEQHYEAFVAPDLQQDEEKRFREVADLKHELDIARMNLREEEERRAHESNYYRHQLELKHEKYVEDDERKSHDLADVKRQLEIERVQVAALELKLERSLHSNDASASSNSLTLESLQKELTICKDDLFQKQTSTATIMKDLKHEMNQHLKDSNARILELESESGFCSAPPPELKPKTTSPRRENAVGQSPVSTSVGSKIFSVLSVVGATAKIAHDVLILPITTVVSGASSSVYHVVHPIAHGAGSHVGKQWNKIVVPPYRSHVEPHVSKVTDSIQGTYNTHMKQTVDTYIEPIHAFAWDRIKSTTYTVFAFFRGDGFLERVSELPASVLNVLSVPFMMVVSYVKNFYGMKLVFGRHAEGAAMFFVTVTSVTLSYLLRRLLLGILTAFIFVLLSPFTFAIFILSRVLGISSGRKRKGKKNLHIELPLGYDAPNVHHASQENLDYCAPLSSLRPAMSSDQWGNEQPMNYYGAETNHIPDTQRYSPPMGSSVRSSIRQSMSTEQWNRDEPSSKYYGADNNHVAAESPRYSPPMAPSVRHSMSSEQWNRDEQTSMYPNHLVSENQSQIQRLGSMTPTAPMMNGDQWSRNEPQAPYYNSNSSSQQISSPTAFPNFAYKHRQSAHEEDYQDNA